jgi:hypothetical protein
MLLGSIRTTKPTNIEKQCLKPQPLQLSSLQYGSAEHFNVLTQLTLGKELIHATALIDSGATSNFRHIDFVKRHNIPQKAKEPPVPLEVLRYPWASHEVDRCVVGTQ